MKEVLELIAKELVDHPEEVLVTEETRDDAVVLKLNVAKQDMGKVIGRGGRIANSIRKVLNAVANHKDAGRVIMEIG